MRPSGSLASVKKPRSLGPYGGHIEIVVGRDEATISRITESYRFAWELRHAARVMAHNAKAVTDEDPFELRPFVTAAVILAYSFLEAGLSEFVFLNATQTGSPLSASEMKIIGDMRRKGLHTLRQHTLQLFNTMLRVLKKESIDKNSEPYGAANAVRSLRNALVHPKPGYVTTFSNDPNEDLSQKQEITKQLRKYLALDRSATFPADILTAKCAAWAVTACESFFHEFVKRSGVSPGVITDGRC
jgi:hypothetical protein